MAQCQRCVSATSVWPNPSGRPSTRPRPVKEAFLRRLHPRFQAFLMTNGKRRHRPIRLTRRYPAGDIHMPAPSSEAGPVITAPLFAKQRISGYFFSFSIGEGAELARQFEPGGSGRRILLSPRTAGGIIWMFSMTVQSHLRRQLCGEHRKIAFKRNHLMAEPRRDPGICRSLPDKSLSSCWTTPLR